jgi:hypothetical protein
MEDCDDDVDSDTEIAEEEDVEPIDYAGLEILKKSNKRKPIDLPRRGILRIITVDIIAKGMKDMFEEENSVTKIQEKRKKLFDMLTNIERKPKMYSSH